MANHEKMISFVWGISLVLLGCFGVEFGFVAEMGEPFAMWLIVTGVATLVMTLLNSDAEMGFYLWFIFQMPWNCLGTLLLMMDEIHKEWNLFPWIWKAYPLIYSSWCWMREAIVLTRIHQRRNAAPSIV